MSARRRNGKLRKLRDNERAARKNGDLLVAHSIADAEHKAVQYAQQRGRYYRYGNDKLVTWRGGKFTITTDDPARIQGFARCPKGLAARVRQALEKGQDRG